MPAPDRSEAIDKIVVVLFENRSLDNVLGRLYRPDDGQNFDGVVGKDLSNPIPEWAPTRRRPQGGALHGRNRYGRAEPGFG